MEEDCRGSQGLSWTVEPRRESQRERDCDTVTVEPEAFSGLQILKLLSVSNNVVRGIKFRTFENMSHLEILHLYNNVIETMDPDSFSGLIYILCSWITIKYSIFSQMYS
jgi:hypothetical protein